MVETAVVGVVELAVETAVVAVVEVVVEAVFEK